MTWPLVPSTEAPAWPPPSAAGGGEIEWFRLAPVSPTIVDTGPICDSSSYDDGIFTGHMNPVFASIRSTINSGQCYTLIPLADIVGMEDFDYLTETMFFAVRPLLPGTGNNEVQLECGLVDSATIASANGKLAAWRELNSTQHAAGIVVGGAVAIAGAGSNVTVHEVVGSMTIGKDPGGTYPTSMSILAIANDGFNHYTVQNTGAANLAAEPNDCFVYVGIGRGSTDLILDKTFNFECFVGRRGRNLPPS